MGKIEQDKLRLVINKRTVPSEIIIEELTDIEVTSGGIFTYLQESIYDAIPDNFLGIYTDDQGVTPYGGEYTVNYDSAVITFSVLPTVTVYAKYRGGGSIIWADDINNLNNAVKIIDNNAVYSDGSVAMSGTLDLDGHSIINATLMNSTLNNITAINNVDINTHKHTGLDGTVQLDDSSISSLSISKISGLQEALNNKQNTLPTPYVAGEVLSNSSNTLIWYNINGVEEVNTSATPSLNIQKNKNYKLTNSNITDITFASCEDSYEETTIIFSIGANPINFLDTSGLVWVDGTPNFVVNMTYLILIWKKYAFIQEIHNA